MSMRLQAGLLVAAALAAGAFFAPRAEADRIVLKNGHEIKDCWVIEEDKVQVVVAIIRQGNIGKIILSPLEIEAIDRTREETLEQALVRARRILEEEAKRVAAEQAAALAATPTARPSEATSAQAPGAGAASGDIKPAKLSELIPPTTPEEDAKIEEAIREIGDTRRQGGAAGRRERALQDLVQFGVKAIPAIDRALDDDVSYRRMNAARAVADIATQDRRVQVYEEAIPKLIKLLYDPQIWVRVAADRALQSVSGKTMSFPEPRGPDLTPDELAAIDRWTRWWESTRQMLPAQ